MSRVFVSYARSDEKIVEEVVARLIAERIHVGVDNKSISIGDDWDAAIKKAIDESKVVLVFLSGNANQSRYVNTEVEYILRKNHDKKIVPILLDAEAKSSAIWPLISDRKAFVFDREQSVTEQVDKLISALDALGVRTNESPEQRARLEAEQKKLQCSESRKSERNTEHSMKMLPLVVSDLKASILLVVAFLLGILIGVFLL